MPTIPQVAAAMRTVLTTTADTAARTTHFVQRASKLGGASFTQTLVFGWLANPQATLDELAQTAATVGVPITAQGLDQRFTPAAAACLQQVLAAAVDTVLVADPVAVPSLQRFSGVYLQDSTTITLPDAVADLWPGCGGRTTDGTQAALKCQVRLDLTRGALAGPLLQAGCAHDRAAAPFTTPLPSGALRVADLGFFDLNEFEAIAARESYWLSRLRAGTVVFGPDGQRVDLPRWLVAQGGTPVDVPVHLGVRHQVTARLLAVAVPQVVADERRRKLRAEARRKGQAVSNLRLALAGWTILVTNAAVELLPLMDALVLARARWQIELLFKLWKCHGRVDESRSAQPWRVLCEVYAKLVAMVIQHWLFLVSCWHYPDRSLPKAAQAVRKHALHLASTVGNGEHLTHAIMTIQRTLRAGGRMNRRKKAPNTWQLLLDLTDGALA